MGYKSLHLKCNNREDCVTEYVKKYGNLVGFFIGVKPFLLVTDEELIRIIQVKEFGNFSNRDFILKDGGVPQPELLKAMAMLQGEDWKRKRSLISPSFSTSKLKKILPIVNEAGDIFMEKLKKSCSKEYINVVGILKNLSLDIITKTALGIDTGVQHSEDSKLVKSARQFLSADITDILPTISMCFPELEPLPTKLRNIIDTARFFSGLSSVKTVISNVRAVVNYRRESSKRREDLLQALMDAKADVKSLLSKRVEELPTPSAGSNSGEGISFSDDEVVANAVNLLVAGFDTTSITLSYLAFYLCRHQDVQDKLREEIKNQLEERKDVTYEDLSNFTYMDQVLSETLRLHSTNMLTINRVVNESMEYKSMTIPKGVTVLIPSTYLQKNPQTWLDPEKFDPERFSPDNKSSVNPNIYQPFGFGPRNCIGMRFAQVVIKAMLARTIRSYRLKTYGDKEPKVDNAIFISQPTEVLVTVEPV